MLVHTLCRVKLKKNKRALTETKARLSSTYVTSQLFINSALTTNLSKTQYLIGLNTTLSYLVEEW
jgi:hypothetical protein